MTLGEAGRGGCEETFGEAGRGVIRFVVLGDGGRLADGPGEPGLDDLGVETGPVCRDGLGLSLFVFWLTATDCELES